MGRKFMQHVFTLIALLGIAAALFLGYKLVKKELDYRKGQEALEDVYRVMDSAVYETEEYSGLDAAEEKERQNRLRLAQYEALNRQNPDMQGWIQMCIRDRPYRDGLQFPRWVLNRMEAHQAGIRVLTVQADI